MTEKISHRRGVIILLGFLTALGPFTLDMYLPAFPAIAKDLQTTTAALALTVSSNFIGIGIGQLFYGSLLDRFGRKKPLYVGLFIYIVASLACMMSHHLEQLIWWRFVAGVGGCVTSVVAYAVVRDLFALEERAKIFSMTLLVMGASPLFAPSMGNVLTLFVGWKFLFLVLALIALMLIFGALILLPPSTSIADKSVRLHPWQMLKDYCEVAINPYFYIYGLCGAISFAALFAYVSGSPLLFLNFFHVSTTTFSWIFTVIAAGYILASQLNIWLLKHWSSDTILKRALFAQTGVGMLFLALFITDELSLMNTIVLLSLLMTCVSLSFSNASVLAITPFGHNTGRASAFISFAQMLFGTISSMGVGMLSEKNFLFMPLIIFCGSLAGLLIILFLRSRLHH